MKNSKLVTLNRHDFIAFMQHRIPVSAEFEFALDPYSLNVLAHRKAHIKPGFNESVKISWEELRDEQWHQIEAKLKAALK